MGITEIVCDTTDMCTQNNKKRVRLPMILEFGMGLLCINPSKHYTIKKMSLCCIGFLAVIFLQIKSKSRLFYVFYFHENFIGIRFITRVCNV